jgi:hypothetical protein
VAQVIKGAIDLGVKAAVKAALASAAVVLTLIGFALGLNIKAVNGPNGICIYCNWPYTGGLVFWAAPG